MRPLISAAIVGIGLWLASPSIAGADNLRSVGVTAAAQAGLDAGGPYYRGTRGGTANNREWAGGYNRGWYNRGWYTNNGPTSPGATYYSRPYYGGSLDYGPPRFGGTYIYTSPYDYTYTPNSFSPPDTTEPDNSPDYPGR